MSNPTITTSITDIVSRYVTLKKEGANLKGLCPFHSEHTPSFYVQESKQRFKCFGCGAGGDVIDFIRLIERTDYKGAIAILTGNATTTRTYAKPQPKQLKPFAIPAERLTLKYSEDYTRSTLWYFMFNLFRYHTDIVQGVFEDYGVMSGEHGLNVFPYRDYSGTIRQIKELTADSDTGKRSKTILPKFNGIALTTATEREEYELIKCFFGGHLLKDNPAMPIAIMEGEKTAIGMTIAERIYSPDKCHIWLATGGKYGVNMNDIQALQPIRNRRIILMPDNDAATEWAKYLPAFRAVTQSAYMADKLAQTERSTERAKYDIWDYTLDELREQQRKMKHEYQQSYIQANELTDSQQRELWQTYQRRGLLPIVARQALRELIDSYGFIVN